MLSVHRRGARRSRRGAVAVACAAAVVASAAPPAPARADATMSSAAVRDGIRGAWVGGVAAAAWGFPVEFDYRGRVVPRDRMPRFSMAFANRYTFHHGFGPDETYVEIPFLDVLVRDPLAGWPEWGRAFADTRFRLFSANLIARRNLRAGISAPASGDPANNPFAYNIDFQIESDFAGLVAPAQPGAAIDIAWRAGHVMNYGDGVYGGVMVAAMTAEAFRARRLSEIVEAGRRAVPEGTTYREMIEDTIRWHRAHPRSWLATWRRLERKWNARSPAAKRDPRHLDDDFNIDAKLNGAYILLGLLYGGGDYARSVRISIRAGQDSDCNPANVGSILGAWKGFRRLPARFRRGLAYGRKLPRAGYTLGRAIAATTSVARRVTALRGGSTGPTWSIPDSPGVAPLAEQWPLAPDEPPQIQDAGFTLNGREASFSVSATDPDGVRDHWWSFGDLSGGPGASPVHDYRGPGSYRATVWVSDALGRTASRVVEVAVP